MNNSCKVFIFNTLCGDSTRAKNHPGLGPPGSYKEAPNWPATVEFETTTLITRVEKNHFYAFNTSPPLYSVDKTLSFNTSLHFTIFRHWKGAGEQRLVFLGITVMIHVFDIFKHNLSMVVCLIDWYRRDIIQQAWWKQVFKKLNLFTSHHLVLRYNPLSPLQKLLSKMP